LTFFVALLIYMGVRDAPAGRSLPQGDGGRVWKDPWLLWVGVLAFSFAGGFLALQTLWAGAYLYSLGYAPVQVGNLLFPYSFSAVLGFLLSGYLADRFGTSRPLLLLRLLVPAYLLLGFFGAFNVLTLTQARTLVPSSLRGRATTLVNLMGIGGTFLLQWGMGVVVGSLGYGAAFVGLLILQGLALALYLPLLRHSPTL
ncbi:MAG: MFS transporter, partial [Thermaceae bacterium]